MTSKNQEYTEKDIYRFTDMDGIERVHIPWGMITGEIPDGVVYPTSVAAYAFGCFYNSTWYDSHEKTYPERGALRFALIPADRIEVVTEHVEATAMDALQALVANDGKPVDGWKFRDEGGDEVDGEELIGVAVSGTNYFETTQSYYALAFRPVVRVRIKAETKPKPKFKVGDLVEVIHEVTCDEDVILTEASKGIVIEVIRGSKSGDIQNTRTQQLSTEGIYEDGKWWTSDTNLRPWTPGYGYTLDGNPVPPPPEGWEIVPEGGSLLPVGKLCVDGKWKSYSAFPEDDPSPRAVVCGGGNKVRAYACRVVKASLTPETPATTEDSSAVQNKAPGLNDLMGMMTKREAFAMAAMQGILASYDKQTYRTVAMDAVGHADALLTELEK